MADLKKIPPWAWALIAVALGAGVYLYKKDKEKSSEAETTAATSEVPQETSGETAVEQYPYSSGGSVGGGGALGEAAESENQFRELFGQLGTEQKEASAAEQTQFQQLQEQ